MKLNLHRHLIMNYRRALVYWRFFQDELEYGRKDFGWLKRIRFLIKGFNSDKSYRYDLKSYILEEYYRDVDVNDEMLFNLVHGTLLDNKDIFHNLMARLGAGPSIVGTFVNGAFYRYNDGQRLSFESAFSEFPEASIVRSIDGGRENDVMAMYLKKQDTPVLKPLGEEPPVSFDYKILSTGCWKVLEANVYDHNGACGAEYNGSLRVTSKRCRSSGKVNVIFALLKHGHDWSKFTAVDVEEGLVNTTIEIDRDNYLKSIVHGSLPPWVSNTNDRYVVRDWCEAIETVIKTHSLLPNIVAASWSLLHTGEAWEIIDGSNKVDIAHYQTIAGCIKF